MKFRVLRKAQLDAAEAADWYDGYRPSLGAEFLLEVQSIFQRIQKLPLLGERLEELTGRTDIRRVILSRFPYVVIYHCAEREISVLAVSHARRDPGHWLDRIG